MNYIIIFVIIFFIPNIIFYSSMIPIRFIMMKDKNKQNSNIINIIHDQKGSNKKTNNFRTYLRLFIYGYIRYFIINVGMIPSHSIRNFIYRYILLVNLADYAIIYYGLEIRAPYNLKIGKGSIIGDKSILDARNGIEIGENVNFSSNVHIWTEQHDHRDPYFECNSDHSFKVTIGNRAWIGPNVTILPKVTIGEGAVVAAGSVVTKNVEPFTIVAGLPAKKIGERNRDLRYIFNGKPSPFY